jgi:MFS family permease
MSLWFSASAVTPQLRSIWGLTTAEAGWLTTIVQLGFVCGTAVAAVLNLADVIPAGRLFSVSALLGAVANAAILSAPGFPAALGFRFLTGFFLAGVYPPAMKMTATWFKAERGFAIGVIVGALTVGKAIPYLVRALPHDYASAMRGTGRADRRNSGGDYVPRRTVSVCAAAILVASGTGRGADP